MQSLDPKNVFDIQINKASYRKYAGRITQDYINQTSFSMTRSRDTSFIIDTVFVKVLSTGKNMTLYTSSDQYKTHFYYSDDEQQKPVELIYRLYYDDHHADRIQNIGNTVNENTYMQQLFALAVKHNVLTDKLTAEIDWSRYDQAYLIRIAKKINDVK